MNHIESISMKFDRHLDSSAAAASFAYQSDQMIMNTDIAVANTWYKTIYLILKRHPLCFFGNSCDNVRLWENSFRQIVADSTNESRIFSGTRTQKP